MNLSEGISETLLEGAMIGAALGTPFSGLKEGHIQQLTGGRVEGFLPSGAIYPARPSKNRLPGLHGAGGQRLLSALSLSREDDQGRHPIAVVGATMLDLAGGAEGEATGAWRQPGRSLRRALQQWRESWPWEPTDFYCQTPPQPQFGSGMAPALAGLAPVILGRLDIVEDAASLAGLTHIHQYSIAATVAVAIAARAVGEHAGSGKKFNGERAARAIVEEVAAFEQRHVKIHNRAWRELGFPPAAVPLSDALSALPSLVREENDDLAVRTILASAKAANPGQGVSHPQHGFAPAGIVWALYRALGPLVPAHAVEDVINRGGECETTAGIVCALMAVRFGLESLPEEWRKGTLGRGVAAELLRAPGDTSHQTWLAAEAGWSGREEALQAPLRQAEEAQQRSDAERERQKRLKARDENKAAGLPPQEDALFAPPPHLWLEPGDEEHPAIKRKLKAARGKKKIAWKEDRRKQGRADEDQP